ncbi:MAG: Ni/Fe hydrogenase subunit alpha [Anaerolineales bacterium]
MTQTIKIDPVTRIEGHAKISIFLDDNGTVEDARFHVTQLRGFETLCEGRPFREMPAIMARICGICPVSHLIAGAKACDELLAVRIPPTAEKLRQVMNLGQIVQSHALNFFYLSAPDLLLGMDSDPAQRNIFGVLQTHPKLARGGINVRKFGQTVIEILGEKRIHSSWVIPGGVTEPLTEAKREQILGMIPEVKTFVADTLEWFIGELPKFEEEIANFANFHTLYMGLTTPEGGLEFYDGLLRVVDSRGNVVLEPRIDPYKYQQYLGEAVEGDSYLKSPYYIPMGYPEGMMRVGPLARLHIAGHCGTPLADEALRGFKALPRETRNSTFHYHYARLIEMLFCIEKIEELLHDPDILGDHLRAHARPNAFEGVGISEAPRGTLLHHYKIDRDGLVTYANLIIATGFNNLGMNRGVRDAARHFIKGEKLQEGMLNRVEAVIRAFDPCLSCSTHAIGKMPLNIQLHSPDGAVLDEVLR